jgi:NAD(P)-dependent dehydrogenase (short-subunit alcohol dehydrogenase family)
MANHLFKPSSALLRLSLLDVWTLDDAYMGTLSIGGTGSGKTSGSGRAIAHAFLRGGFGGLVLCAKPEEADLWRRYAAETGRQESLVILGADSPHRFNFLEYELARIDGGATKTSFALEALLKIYEAMQTYDGVKADESFWRNSVRLLLSHSIDILFAAYGRLKFPELWDLINSAPRTIEEYNSEKWRAESFFWQSLERAGREPARPLDIRDYKAIISYALSFAALDPKTRSNIIATMQAMVMDFQKGDLARVFCTDTTIVPELSHHGAVIVLDFPIKIWQRGGVLAQQLFKFAWQRAIERRRVTKATRPCFLWADEYQLFISSYDAEFQSTARSSRACTVYMTQSIPALRDAVRSNIPKENVDALLNNFQTKIIHTVTDPTTQEWAANMIGKGIQIRETRSVSMGKGMNWGQAKGTNRGWSWGRSKSASHGTNRQGGGSTSHTDGMHPSNSAGSNWGWGTSDQTSHGINDGQSGGSNESESYGSNQSVTQGVSRAETMDFHVQPSYFGSALRMGGERNNFLVDGVIMQGGRIWKHNNSTWLLCTFPQK